MRATAIDWTAASSQHNIERLRPFMWNADQLALLAARAGLGPGLRIADIGCGNGHFGLGFLPCVLAGGQLDGFDRVPQLLEHAREAAADRGLDAHATFAIGDAMRLPAKRGTYDATLCQTLLMHLDKPEQALAEMVRVTRPGGVVMVAEPDFLLSLLTTTYQVNDERTHAGPDDREQRSAFELFQRIFAARRERGLGDFRIGRRLASLFERAGLVDVDVRLNDRVNVLTPPYTAADQPSYLACWMDLVLRDGFAGHEGMFRDDFVAAGGTGAEFDAIAKRSHERDKRLVDAARARTLVRSQSHMLFVAIGRRPAARF